MVKASACRRRSSVQALRQPARPPCRFPTASSAVLRVVVEAGRSRKGSKFDLVGYDDGNRLSWPRCSPTDVRPSTVTM